VKTLAIKLEDSTHAQLTAIAQLEGLPVTTVIKEAVETAIEAKRHQPELSGKAEAMLDEIEREAAARREAIATLFGSSDEAAPEATEGQGSEPNSEPGAPTPLRRSRGKGGEPADS
jgi:hypothetical protein